jgi:hypothetical protein
MMHHLPDGLKSGGLAEVRRVLKPARSAGDSRLQASVQLVLPAGDAALPDGDGIAAITMFASCSTSEARPAPPTTRPGTTAQRLSIDPIDSGPIQANDAERRQQASNHEGPDVPI